MVSSVSDPARTPVVGLTTYLERATQGVWDVRASFLPQQYFDAVTASGATAVLLPPQPRPEQAAAAVLDGLDGVILTGGLDVQPELYGAERHPLTDPPRADRDAWELALLAGARERGIPVFGICRGLQLINVALGGTLHQHLPEALGTERYKIGGGVFAENVVEVDAGTRLAGLVGAGALTVHSYHHQGIDRVAEGLVVTARTDDGLVQAVELPGEQYLVAVQWHPEENAEDRRLFLGLVAAAAAHRAARGGGRVVRCRVRDRPHLRVSGSPRMSTFTVTDPSTGAPITTLARAEVEHVDAAVADAVRAQRAWAALAPVARADALRSFARVVEAHIDELATLEVRNSGHPIGSARWEAQHVAQVLNYYAGSPERLIGKQIPVAGGLDVTYHEPYGVIGIIVPWNFPMTIAAWGFAPALAAGNAVVLKPAELTPLTAIRLGELALEAGLPEGLFRVVVGSGSVVGQRFVSHPDVHKVVFTGSTEVGTEVAAGCAGLLKPVTLELGGKSANIVFADADLEKAAAGVPGSVFDNAGQDCCARSRLLVERSVYDRFLELLEPAVAAWRVGDPRDEDTQMGPLISASHRSTVAGFLEGADVAFRGSAPEGDGFWFAPAVVLAQPGDRIAREEVFGPVLAVLPFDDEADAIRLANDTAYGLAGSIWTENLGRGIRVSRGVRSGVLSVNSHSSVRYATPFGGMKASGLGRELGPDAAEHFTEIKNVFYATE